MDADGPSSGWLLLLAQLPGTPSSARVALWRRLRAIGATAVVNGAWVLPDTASHAKFFEQLRRNILGQGGTAFVLGVPVSPPDVYEAIAERFRADRGREYDEFAERCGVLLDEIGRESRAGKYTFAEMEESEQDLQKLTRWLAKIKARDFFPDERANRSAELLERCRSAIEGFSQAVYAAEGVQEPADGVLWRPPLPRLGSRVAGADGRRRRRVDDLVVGQDVGEEMRSHRGADQEDGR
jgi:transcriptional regulator with XRE-family HTH domain